MGAASLSDLEARMDAKMEASEARILAAIQTIGGAASEGAYVKPPARNVSTPAPVVRRPTVEKPPAPAPAPAPAMASPPVAVLRTKSANANIKQLALIAKDQLVASSAAGGVAGVIMSQGCIDQFDKARRGRNNVRWASFGWDPLGSGWIVPIEEADGTEDLLGDWDSFVANLPDQKPLFCFYNFTYFETDSMTA